MMSYFISSIQHFQEHKYRMSSHPSTVRVLSEKLLRIPTELCELRSTDPSLQVFIKELSNIELRPLKTCTV